MNIKDNYALLIEKLDAFIRKFYVNQLLRGALWTVGTVLSLFIALTVAEHFFYFSSSVRTFLFWGFLGTTAVAFYQWIALPLLHYFRLGKVISHEQAASIIGQHFDGVKDKLLNILQLREQSKNALHAELINASINQKSDEIRLVPFTGAIDLAKNRQYLRWALPPVLLLLFLFFGAPTLLKNGTFRLFNPSTKFEKPAPFKIILEEEKLQTVQFSDFLLTAKVEGDALPNELFINLGDAQYRLTKDATNTFSYKFLAVQKDVAFNLFGGGVESKDFTLDVLEKPNILSFAVNLDFPNYIGRPDEALQNVGDLVVPQGTNLGWAFEAEHTEAMALFFGNEKGKSEVKRSGENLFQINRRAMRDEPYRIFISNKNVPNGDSIAYSITVIPDLSPEISVEKFEDTTSAQDLFFAGDASDDYGLSSLTFNYQIKKAKGGQLPMASVPMARPSGKTAQYDYHFQLKNLELAAGDEVTYYFETFDNDGVNGAKSARTAPMVWKMPTLGELQKAESLNNEEIKKDLEKALKESKKVQEDLKKLREKVLQQKELDWQSKKELEKLLNQQKQLEQKIQQAKQNFEENLKKQEQFQPEQNQKILDKQEELKKMFDEVLSDEMREMMKQIEDLLQELNKDEALEKMENMQMNNEEVEKELDRLKELFKQLEVEKELNEQIEQLEELAKKEEELGDKSEKGEEKSEELEKKQEELNKEFEELQKKMDETEKKNEELERPQEMPETEEQEKEIEKEMKDSKDDLEKKENKKASKKQKSAAKKMKDMANSKKAAKEKSEEDQNEEDMKAIRQLLENIIGLSFNEESNMNDIRSAMVNTPRYVELVQGQFKIKDDFRIVDDSLTALAKRNEKIQTFVLDKVADVKADLKYSLNNLEERQIAQANERQQSAMKNLNDLALMLAEAMDAMQQQMKSESSGDGSCDKPGGKGKGKGKKKGKKGEGGSDGPKDKMSKGQGDLNDMMKKLKERLEKQGKEGGKEGKDGKPGQEGGKSGSGGAAKEFAQMAAKQAALRKALQDAQKEKQSEGKGSKALDEIIKEMDKTETELVNKRLTNEMMKRQQDIMTRLLEEERAEREQEQDEQREAERAQNVPNKMPPALEEYLKLRRAEVDGFRTVSPALRPYYKALVEEYLKSVQK